MVGFVSLVGCGRIEIFSGRFSLSLGCVDKGIWLSPVGGEVGTGGIGWAACLASLVRLRRDELTELKSFKNVETKRN